MKNLLLLILSSITLNVAAQFTADMNFVSSEDENINPTEILNSGQYIYLDFFSTTCGACNSVASEINNAYEAYGANNQSVFFIGVDNFSSASSCIDFSTSHNSEFPVIAGQEGGGGIFTLFNINGYPKGVLIDPSGEVITTLSYSSIANLTESLEDYIIPTNDCEQVEVTSTVFNSESNQIELSINTNSSYLFGYPSFALFNNNGDTLAMEQVFYYGLSGESTHTLDVNIPISDWDSEINLQLYSGFYQTMECSFILNSNEVETAGCTDIQAANYNENTSIDNGTCLYSLNYFNTYINLDAGWNLVGFSCAEQIDAITAFSPYIDNIVIVKDNLGTAYLPEYGFNGIGNLERGLGYQLKINEEIVDFNLCNP